MWSRDNDLQTTHTLDKATIIATISWTYTLDGISTQSYFLFQRRRLDRNAGPIFYTSTRSRKTNKEKGQREKLARFTMSPEIFQGRKGVCRLLGELPDSHRRSSPNTSTLTKSPQGHRECVVLESSSGNEGWACLSSTTLSLGLSFSPPPPAERLCST